MQSSTVELGHLSVVGGGAKPQEDAIATQWAQADVERCLKVADTLWRFFLARSPISLDAESMWSHALEGVLKALSSFEEGRGAKLSTYAGVCVQNALKEGLRKEDYLSRGRREKVRQHGITDPVDLPPVRLDEIVAADDGEIGTGTDALPDGETCTARDAEQSLEAAYIAKHVGCLAEDEAQVIRMVYYWKVNRADIGRFMGTSKSHVQRIENRALKLLKRAMLADPHCPFLDDVEDDPSAPLFCR